MCRIAEPASMYEYGNHPTPTQIAAMHLPVDVN